MSFKFNYVNKFGRQDKETIIANNKIEAKSCPFLSAPSSKILDVKWVYK